MGDIVSLVERAAETIDKEDAEKLAARVRKGQFDMDDLLSQLRQLRKMGGLSGPDGHAAGRHAGQGGDVEGQDRREAAQAPGGGHPRR